MTAITKSWTSVADAAIDPDSPITTSLMTALRDNDIYLREWLGASFYAGAVQDHNHDGSNSARVDVGPNLVRNPSFEDGSAGWTLTNYTGGSNAISTSQRRHGAKSLAFTSTSTANGGGEAITNEYIPVAEGQAYSFSAWVLASTANVSSKVQVVYYDAAQSSLSTVDLYTATNTGTSWARQTAQDTAPASARYARVKVIGGVPGSGSATGTIYFDHLTMVPSLYQLGIEASAVGRTQLKTTTGSGSVTVNTGTNNTYTLAGGSYAWWTASAQSNAGGSISWGGNTDTASGVIGLFNYSGTNFAWYVDERYVQASPPYDLGNGEVPLFVWALVDGAGNVVGTQVAPDPTWAYHGPTDITPQFWRGGRPFRRYAQVNGQALGAAMKNRDTLAAIAAGDVDITWVEREITQAVKNADMGLCPHPFFNGDTAGCSVILLDPVGALCERLQAIQIDQGARAVRDLLTAGHLRLDNSPLDATTPPGVQAVRARFLNTKGA